MKRISLFSLPLLIVILVTTISQPIMPPPAPVKLVPGDQIYGMGLETHAAGAPPIWGFCSPPEKSVRATIVECHVPPLPKLAIGHTYRIADEALQQKDWSELTWNLYLNRQPLDLDAFGMYSVGLPSILESPNQIREVFRKITAWDVVLTNLKPGVYILHGVARVEDSLYTWEVDSYAWVIYLTVEGKVSR